MSDILRRIEALEKKYVQDPLIVLLKTADGQLIKRPVRDVKEDEWDKLEIVRVVDGSCVEDLDLVLKRIKDNASKEEDKDEQV